MEINKMLTLSTGHCRKEDMEDLNKYASMTGEYGMLIYVYDKTFKEEIYNRHLNYRIMTNMARMAGCSYIMFDRDVPSVAELQTFDW